MTRSVSSLIAAMLVLSGIAGQVSAFEGSYGVKLGYHSFNGDKDYWAKLQDTFKADERTFDSMSFGLVGAYPLASFLEWGFGVSYVGVKKSVESRKLWDINGDGVTLIHNYGNEIQFELLPVTLLDLRILPMGRDARYSPYLGIGTSVVFWRYEETGTFVLPDTTDADRDGRAFGTSEVPDYLLFQDEKVDFAGTYLSFELSAGMDFQVYKHITLSAGGRYTFIKDQVDRAFNFVSIRPPANGLINIKDIQVNNLHNYDPLELGALEFEIAIKYKF